MHVLVNFFLKDYMIVISINRILLIITLRILYVFNQLLFSLD